MKKGSADHELPPEDFVKKVVTDALTDPETGDWRTDLGLDDTGLMGMAERINDITHAMGQNGAFLNIMQQLESLGEIPEGRTADAIPDYNRANSGLERRKTQLRDMIRAHLGFF